MLFAYKYIPHIIDKMQTYIDFLFLHVWCEANGDFDINKLDGCPDLKEMVLAIYHDDGIEKDYLYGPIKEIYDIFKSINKKMRKKLKRWYLIDNCIEELCNNKSCYEPMIYADLRKRSEALSDKLESFFKTLYSSNFLSLKAIRSKVGNIDEHYDSFMKENNTGKCPYCGLNDLKSENHSKREAYDHYLPKDIYPFNSINFKNLAPICHECNSSYKLKKDPLHDKAKNRRKAFYSYMFKDPGIKVEINIRNMDIAKLTPDDIQLKITSEEFAEEVQTWEDLFDIEERYKIKCSSRTAKYWYTQVIDEAQNYNVAPHDAFLRVLKSAEKEPFEEINFLRKSFLDACENKNLFRLGLG